MNLKDFDIKNHAHTALKENYDLPFNLNELSMPSTKAMLKKVRTLAMETKQSPDFYKAQTSPTYMKLVFMEQALVSHYNNLMTAPVPRIVVENEEVEKSQVVLAAQDMVDSVQKMVEDASDMLVKELPALVDSIQSEIGVNESTQFNTQVTEALTGLSAALGQAKTTLQSALNTLTGQGGGEVDAFGAEPAPEEDLGAMPGDEMGSDVSVDDTGMAPEEELPAEEPEMPPVGGVGRAKR